MCLLYWITSHNIVEKICNNIVENPFAEFQKHIFLSCVLGALGFLLTVSWHPWPLALVGLCGVFSGLGLNIKWSEVGPLVFLCCALVIRCRFVWFPVVCVYIFHPVCLSWFFFDMCNFFFILVQLCPDYVFRLCAITATECLGFALRILCHFVWFLSLYSSHQMHLLIIPSLFDVL